MRCPRAQQCGGERIHCSRRHFKPVRADMDFIDCSACNDASSSPTFSPWQQTFCLNTKGWAPVRVRREELLNDCVIICLFLIRVKLPFPWDVKESRNSRLFRVFLHKVIFNIFLSKIPVAVLSKGQVLTKYYRWMNKNGGWVWMQTKASLIPHPTNPDLKQMLCLNYIVR